MSAVDKDVANCDIKGGYNAVATRRRWFCAVALLALILGLWGQMCLADSDTVRLRNQYIELIVNNGSLDTGRFAIDTTGGDPGRTGDEGQPLIYGSNLPWTSFTTVRIDGKDYVFGGNTKRRAGKTGNFGQIVRQPSVVGDNSIQMDVSYGAVSVMQTLALDESPTTGLPDSARIKYTLRNNDSVPHNIGLRAVIDTMLGSNDGAPFRVGDEAKSTAALYSGNAVPEFWQAFDSLSQPRVTAQGTLRGDGLTPPDRMYFIDWGTPADDLWNFPYKAGTEFLRKGEGELDSATVLFWDPKPLNPGESRNYITMYGLGGLSIAPGALALGITSPASFQYAANKQNTFSIVAYVNNTGEVKARDVKAKLNLPNGLRVVDSTRRRGVTQSLGDVPASGIAQALWTVEVVDKNSRTAQFSVSVTGRNTEANEVKRSIKIDGPPAMSVQGTYNDGILKVKVKNPGPGIAENVTAKLLLPKGLKVSGMEEVSKPVGPVAPGETVTIGWQMDRTAGGKGDASVIVSSTTTDTMVAKIPMNVVAAKDAVSLRLVPAKSRVDVNQPVVIDLWLTGAALLSDLEVDVAYDSVRLDLVRTSRGTLAVRNDQLLPWTAPDLSREGVVAGLKAKPAQYGKSEGTLVTLHGVALSPGDASVKITRIRAVLTNGKLLDITPQAVKITVE